MSLNEHTFKLVVIGDPMVGKTSIINRFITKTFNHEYLQTLGTQLNCHEVVVGDVLIRLIIWDLAGQPRFESVRKLYFLGSDAVLVVFDLTRAETFDNIEGWLQAFRTAVPDEAPSVLVGNKVDLDSRRVISRAEAYQRHINLEFDNYFESSARSGENVGELFDQVTRLLIYNRLAELRERLTPFIYSSFAS
ncbi:MAG: Rab family GTPase [Candidatus Odinarchaeota archaeon]|jgi:small GTP-binding protein|nr:Rab family GTPase [Candidatus Hermodarchaeota archaeon]